jgi:hypothetical protein
MDVDERIADSLAETSEPLGFADVRVLMLAERARIALSQYRAHANGRPLPGRVRFRDEKQGFLFRPPYWMVIADTGE